MRTGAAVSIAVLFAAAAAASGHPVGTRAPDGSLAVGYASAGALVRAARASHGTIVRTFPALRVAEVRGANSRTLGRASGIRFVQLAATRESAGGPVGY